MKLTIWQAKSPATVDDMKSEFARKLGAFRAATGRPERFVTRCACAIHDKGFTVVYERADPARPFILTGIYRDGESEVASGASAPESRMLQANEIDHTGWRCPFCGDERVITCNRCHTVVCGGRTRRYPGTNEIFNCRASCGARGTLIEAKTVPGFESASRPGTGRPVAARPLGPDAPLLVGPKTPRLKR